MNQTVARKEVGLGGIAQLIPVVTGCRTCGLMGQDPELRK
jgi:hypothetical protein